MSFKLPAGQHEVIEVQVLEVLILERLVLFLNMHLLVLHCCTMVYSQSAAATAVKSRTVLMPRRQPQNIFLFDLFTGTCTLYQGVLWCTLKLLLLILSKLPCIANYRDHKFGIVGFIKKVQSIEEIVPHISDHKIEFVIGLGRYGRND
jgi:hypothetical protein